MTSGTADSKLRQWVAGALLVATTVSLAGIGDRVLNGAGYPVLAAAFWVVCYAGAMFVVWYVWLRHVDFTGAADS
jgi:hypothetical protein